MDINYIWGDLHLGDNGNFNRIYSKTFATKEEYAENFVKENNAVIFSNRQRVLFLGDIGQKEWIEKYIPQMRGYKILILGNHDNLSKTFYLKYFDEVYDHPIFINNRVVFSHEPIPTESGVINIHGHTHSIKLRSERHFNWCPEWTNYKPVAAKNIHGILSQIEKPNRKFLQEWFKDIQEWHMEEDPRLFINEDGLILSKETLHFIKTLKEELSSNKKNN